MKQKEHKMKTATIKSERIKKIKDGWRCKEKLICDCGEEMSYFGEMKEMVDNRYIHECDKCGLTVRSDVEYPRIEDFVFPYYDVAKASQ